MLHAEIHAVQENGDSAIPLIGIGLRDATNCSDNSCVVEHDVDASKFFDCKIDGCCYLIFVRDIGVDVTRVGTKFLSKCKARFILDVGDDDFGALFNEATNSPSTDTTCGSGDDCDFVL